MPPSSIFLIVPFLVGFSCGLLVLLILAFKAKSEAQETQERYLRSLRAILTTHSDALVKHAEALRAHDRNTEALRHSLGKVLAS